MSGQLSNASARWQVVRDTALVPGGLALIAHVVGLACGFVADDLADIAGHPVVTGERPLWSVLDYNYMGEAIGEGVNTIRPLATLLFGIEWRLWGDSPALFHAVSIAWFCALVWISHRYLRHLMAPRQATVATCLFASLAIHVDAVAMVANSAEVLALGLSIVALLAVERSSPALAALACVAALLAKESAFPIAGIAVARVWLADGVRALHPRNRRARAAWAVVAGAAVYVVARLALLSVDVRGSILSPDNLLLDQPLDVRVWMPLSLLGRYVALAVAPLGLSFDYTYSAIPVAATLADPYGWLGAAFAAVLVAAGVRAYRSGNRAIAFVVLAFFASYSLFSNSVFLIVTLFAERLFLAPSLWLCALAALAGATAIRRVPAVRQSLAILLAVTVAVQVSLAAARTWECRSESSLFAAQAASQPDSVKGRLYHARSLARRGEFGEAIWHLSIASAGRRAFPSPWRAPREWEARPLEQRLRALPAIAAPDMEPSAFWRETRAVADRSLGRGAAEFVDVFTAYLASQPSVP